MFIQFAEPTAANIIEYTCKLIKKDREPPQMTHRIMRYLRETSPLLDGLPRMVCAYVKADFNIEPSVLKRILDRMDDTADRAIAAMQLVGVVLSTRNMAITIGEYNNGAFYSQRIPEWAAYYVEQHIAFMRSIGYGDDDILFVRFADEGVVPYTKKKGRRLLQKWSRKSGKNLSAMAKLAHWYGHIPKDVPMKYF
jgi:hypothetical protein